MTGLRRTMAVAVLLGAVLTGCGGGGEESGDSAASGGAAAAGSSAGNDSAYDTAAAPEAAPQAGQPAPAATTQARVLPADRDLIFTAGLTVRVEDVTAAAGRAEELTVGKGGLVSGEETVADPDDPARSQTVMTLRVPPQEFRGTLDALAALGTRLSQTQTSQDVTAQVTDVESRIATQRKAVGQVRALLGEAEKIGDIIAIEAELTRREADLESLTAQQRKLSDQTALATVTATFVGTAADVATVAEEDDLGFASGLRDGWDAFTASVAVAATVLGAVLPFVALLVLVGLPAWVLWKRSRRRPAAVTPVTPPA